MLLDDMSVTLDIHFRCLSFKSALFYITLALLLLQYSSISNAVREKTNRNIQHIQRLVRADHQRTKQLNLKNNKRKRSLGSRNVKGTTHTHHTRSCTIEIGLMR